MHACVTYLAVLLGGQEMERIIATALQNSKRAASDFDGREGVNSDRTDVWNFCARLKGRSGRQT